MVKIKLAAFLEILVRIFYRAYGELWHKNLNVIYYPPHRRRNDVYMKFSGTSPSCKPLFYQKFTIIPQLL